MSSRNLTQRVTRVNAGTDPGADIPEIVDTASTASAYKFSAGSGTLVTGSLVVATGLASVAAFVASLNTSGSFATGATQTVGVRATSITTGAVTVEGVFNAFVTGAATVDASGTAKFLWIAIGT